MGGQRIPTTEELMGELNRLQRIRQSEPLSFEGMESIPSPSPLEILLKKQREERRKIDAMNQGGGMGGPENDLGLVEKIVAEGPRPEKQTWVSGSTNQPVEKTGIVPMPSTQSEKQEETFLDESVRQPTVLSDPKILAGETLRNHEWNNKLYKVPPPKESGFLDTILGGVRSFTSPIARGAKELFNDPRRMALITGGLRMADPNSYYDRQGFYSPWGGINAGLGTGIKTYRTLSEPRKLGFKKQEEIKQANAMELATHEAQLKSQYGTDSREWATWLQYKKMLPKNKQNDPNEYLKWKRSVPWLNTGPEFVQPLPTNAGGGEPRKIIKGLNPSEQPSHKKEVATQTAVGKGVGEDMASARSKLPMMELELEEMEALSEEFIKHDGFSDLIGATWKPFAKNIHGTSAAGADSIRKQLEGKLFMKAYQTLKGGGQITEIEGDQAKQAQGRMNIALSEVEYKKALTDFLDAYRRGLEKLKGVAYPVGTNPQRRKGEANGNDPLGIRD